jgi:Skp family chaperone for outer membrane proteins
LRQAVLFRNQGLGVIRGFNGKSMSRYFFLTTLLLVMLVAGSVSAQRPAGQRPPAQPTSTPAPTATAPTSANVPMSKMAVIYSDMFLDQKSGILKFTSLLNKLNGEFQKIKDDIDQMKQRGKVLEEEISKLQNAPAGTPIDQKSLQAKIDQLELLKKDIQRKSEDAQANYTRRRQVLFQPLQEEIGKAMEIFAKARGITVIIDLAQVPLIYAADNTDITKAFIIEFNSKNPVTASTTPPQ